MARREHDAELAARCVAMLRDFLELADEYALIAAELQVDLESGIEYLYECARDYDQVHPPEDGCLSLENQVRRRVHALRTP